MEAQVRSIYGTVVKDINQDGNLNILWVSNHYSTEVLTGRYDAGIVNYLQGDGKGNFKNVRVLETNFFVKGNAQAIAEITLKAGTSLLLTSELKDKILVFKQIERVLDKINSKRKEEFHIVFGYLSQTRLEYSR